MGRGIAIAIGVNRLDPSFYTDFEPIDALLGCVNDAADIARVAAGAGLAVGATLRDETATRANLEAEFARAASVLVADDLLVLHYSGHGCDFGTSTAGHRDTAWCLHDGPYLNHELFRLWFTLAAGVRVLLLSDSCHSGLASREAARRACAAGPEPSRPVPRVLPESILAAAFRDHPDVFAALRARSAEIRTDLAGSQPGAGVLLLSGCRLDQESNDGTGTLTGHPNGMFTSAVLEVWRDGAFEGSHIDFHATVLDLVRSRSGSLRPPTIQEPDFNREVGDPDVLDALALARPFTVD